MLKLDFLSRWIGPVATKCVPYHPETLSNCQEMFCTSLGARGTPLWVSESSLERIPASPVGLGYNHTARPWSQPGSGEIRGNHRFFKIYTLRGAIRSGGEQLGDCFPHFHRLIHLLFIFLDEAALAFQFFNFYKRKMVPPEHQNLDPRVDPEVDPAFGASGPQTEPWIFHDSTVARCHTLGGST